jgi:hypothetical protein
MLQIYNEICGVCLTTLPVYQGVKRWMIRWFKMNNELEGSEEKILT